MTEYFFHPDLVRLGFVLGILVSILIYERQQLTTGGIAVPGYLGFAIFLPLLAPAVLILALATHWIVHRWIARLRPLSHAAQFSLLILVSVWLHLLVDLGALALFQDLPGSPLLRGIGYIVPGLIAHDVGRHGIASSLRTIGFSSAIVAVVLFITVWLVPEVGRMNRSPVEDVFPIHLDWTPVIVVLSMMAWFALTRVGDLRCGGFLGGTYLTLLIGQPNELLLFAVLAMVTIGLTKTVLEPTMILFGRRKFAAVLLLGACLSWGAHWVRELWLGGYTISVVTPSLAVLGVLLTGLLVSDIDRVGLSRTLVGLAANLAFTLTGTLLVAELVLHGRAAVALPLGLALAGMTALLLLPALSRGARASAGAVSS